MVLVAARTAEVVQTAEIQALARVEDRANGNHGG
jgi:hypothetical protein